ncbi:MAG: TlyA family RNA methyltransferase [Acholeplasmataceae bacterium]
MRLDKYLNEKYPEYTRSKHQDLIKRGHVLVNGKTILKTGHRINQDDKIEINKEVIYKSRAADKLKYALNLFNISLLNKIVIDVGASTGGFTDLSLKEGAKLVYAYDVGTNQMDESLLTNPKVKSFEKTNILSVIIPNNDICLVDVSFTSVIPILNYLKNKTNEVLFLLKPQFEVTKGDLKKGILKDLKKHDLVLKKIISYIDEINYQIKGFTKSPILGKDGNIEYIFYILRSENA